METEFVTLGDAADRLNVPAPTLRGWCDKLEELKVHFLERNNRDDRIFYDIDMEIMRFIKEQKDIWGRKTTTTDLAKMVGERFDCRKSVLSHSETKKKHNNETIIDFEQLLENLSFNDFIQSIIQKTIEQTQKQHVEELKKAFDLIAVTNNKYEQIIKQLPEPKTKTREDENKETLSQILTIRKVENELQEQALLEWSKKPESERFIKTGFFKKEENRDKRDLFIRDYINRNFESRLREEIEKFSFNF